MILAQIPLFLAGNNFDELTDVMYNSPSYSLEDIPLSLKNDREMHNLPLLPLRGVVIFPGSVTTLDVGR